MLFLYDVQSPINIGLTLRTAEQFQDWVTLYDPRNILSDPDKIPTISDFSCGALGRRAPEIVTSLADYRAQRPGRMIATCLEANAVPLHDFAFQDSDIIVLGNEYDGLPAEVIAGSDAKLYIPLPPGTIPKPRSFSPIDPGREEPVSQDGIPNLNVSMTAAIISYAWHTQRILQWLSLPKAPLAPRYEDGSR